MKEFTIANNEANQRLDKYLKKLFPNANTSFLYKMLRKKNIVLNNKKATGKEIVFNGDRIRIYFSDETFAKFQANQDLLKEEYAFLKTLPMKKLSVIYEDDDILIANKPYNMLSQKSTPNDISANEYLLGYFIRSGVLSFEQFLTFRPSVCNRLDRNTTGLLLVGKSLLGAQQLSEMLRNRSIQKYYYAIVHKTLHESEHLSGYLIKNSATNTVTILNQKPDTVLKDEKVSYIETEYKPIKHGKNCTLVEVHLITGKTHQIRAHLSSIGHPIIGDPKYGKPSMDKDIKKSCAIRHQLLHAYRVVFPDGKEFIAEEPAIFQEVLSR